MTPSKVAVSSRVGRVAFLGTLARALLVLLPTLLIPAAAAAQLTVTRIPLKTNDLVYDPHSARAYASVPNGETNGNSIAVIDPVTATIETYIALGSSPNKLAVSDDGQYLYVGLDDSHSVRVIDLPTRTAGQEFSLGLAGDLTPSCVAVALAVQSGRNDVVAVLAGDHFGGSGYVKIFDGGVERPVQSEWLSLDSLVFASESVIYGARRWGAFRTILVDADGATATDQYSADFDGGRIQIANGIVYSATRSIVPATGLVEVFGLQTSNGTAFALDPAHSRVGVVTDERKDVFAPPAYSLTFYDLATYTPVSRYPLTEVAFSETGTYPAAVFGDGKMVFADNAHILIVTGAAAPMHSLRINKTGRGTGSVTASAGGIGCGSACEGLITEGTVIRLTATASTGSTFEGWSGDDDCLDGVVTMAASRACTAGFASTSRVLSVRRLALRASDLALSGSTGHLLATVRGLEPEWANRVVDIDPSTGGVSASDFVATRLGVIAAADDGRTVYAGQDESSGLFRIDTQAGSEVRYDLGKDGAGCSNWATAMAVQPGVPGTVVLREAHCAQHNSVVTVLDDGVHRGTGVETWITGELTFGGTADTVYALSSHVAYSLPVLQYLRLDGSGLSETQSEIDIEDPSDIKFGAGLIFTSNGRVVNPETDTLEVRFLETVARSLAVDVAADRVYFLQQTGQTQATLSAYVLTSGRLLWSEALDLPENTDVARRLLQWGPNGLAFLTDEAVYVIDIGLAQSYRLLDLKKVGYGSGTVTSSSGLSCTSRCSALLPVGTVVTLSAQASAGSTLAGWQGDEGCRSGTVTLTVGMRCQASFALRDSPGDVDRDGRSDLLLWNSRLGVWTVTYSSSGQSVRSACSSCIGNVAVPGDYNGDGRMDKATWRGSTGIWYIDTPYLRKEWGRGSSGDVPVAADYDGDGTTDLAVWRPGNATWYILLSTKAYSTSASRVIQWGAKGDQPVPGDYDGDGKCDLAVWRPSTGTWHLLLSGTGYARTAARAVPWGKGSLSDKPVQGDYDGDHKCDLAVWRPGTGTWYILQSTLDYASSGARAVQWGRGSLGDVPAPRDCDGDGKLDLVVWRASTGVWYILPSASWATARSVKPSTRGGAGDTPALDYR